MSEDFTVVTTQDIIELKDAIYDMIKSKERHS